ncbi:MAG: hypothetical protein HGA25_05340, partial [Clostridiales bacterium]|nr:hypothetical protein [Clostridiales bacterium]
MSWFNNLKIGFKLIMGFMLVAIIAGAVGLVGIINLQQTNEKYTKLYDNYGIPLTDIAHVAISFQQLRVCLRNIVMEEDLDAKEKIVVQINDYETVLYDSLEVYEATLQTENSKALYADLMSALEDYTPIQTQIVEAALNNDNESALVLLRADSSAAVVKSVMDNIDNLFQNKSQNGEKLAAEYTASTNQTIATVIIIVVIAIIVSMVLGVMISRMISVPIII